MAVRGIRRTAPVMGLLVFVVLLLSGCAYVTKTEAPPRYTFDGEPFSVRMDLNTTEGSGSRIYALSSPHNLTFVVRFDYVQDTGIYDPISLCVVGTSGRVVCSTLLNNEVLVLEEPDEGATAKAGGQEVTPIPAEPGARKPTAGFERIEVPERAGVLILTWANHTSAGHIETYWKDDVTLAPRESDPPHAFSMRSFSEGAYVAAGPVRHVAEAKARIEPKNGALFCAVKLSHPPAGAGLLKVQDDQGERTISLNRLEHGPGSRHFMTTEGFTTFVLSGAGGSSLRAFVLCTPTGADVRLGDVWVEVAEEN